MTQKPKVLLVDDDVGFLKATSLVLEEAGFCVVTAEDGRAGLAAARAPTGGSIHTAAAIPSTADRATALICALLCCEGITLA